MAETDEIHVNNTKKIKLDDDLVSIHDDLNNLEGFEVETVLRNNTDRKTICLKGSFSGKTGVALVMLEKSAFSENIVTQNYLSDKSQLTKEFSNDIYGNYHFYPPVEFNGLKATIIHPATDKHIEKYSAQKIHLVDETIDVYNKITLPFITKDQFNLQWVYNILEHKKESDRIIFEDPDPVNGFILLPDLKWDNKTIETLYLCAITHRKGIKSIRDLTHEHLVLLENIYANGTKAIEDKFGIPPSQLRIYLHYQPSFYHLHVHFTFLRHEAPGIFTEKSHMLTTVFSNIKLLSDYYQKVTLPFVVRESDNLYSHLIQNDVLKKPQFISKTIIS